MTLKYNLEDDELQEMADRLKSFIREEYADDAEGIPEHVLNALAQNYVINHKDKNFDIEKLLKDYNIGNE